MGHLYLHRREGRSGRRRVTAHRVHGFASFLEHFRNAARKRATGDVSFLSRRVYPFRAISATLTPAGKLLVENRGKEEIPPIPFFSQGLCQDEAHAMVEAWRDSWFEEGSRLLHIVPAAFVDGVLPLSINPV